MLGRSRSSSRSGPGPASAPNKATRASPGSKDSAKVATLLLITPITWTSYASVEPAVSGPGSRCRRRSLVRVPAQARLAGADDGLGAVGATQLGEDPRDVGADGMGAEEEPVGDPGVVVPAGYEVEDLALPRGQLGEGPCGVGLRLAQEPREPAR